MRYFASLNADPVVWVLIPLSAVWSAHSCMVLTSITL